MGSAMPFQDIQLSASELIRTFDSNVDESELKWHQDNEHRIISVVEGYNWKIQFENKIPTTLSPLESIEIPRLEWHRLIKGSGNLVVKITKVERKS